MSSDYRRLLIRSFLWVDRQLEELRACRSVADVDRALSALPRGMAALYDRIVSKIQHEGSWDLAKRILKWLAVAVRPLHVQEVAEAVMIGPEISVIDEDNRLFDPKEEQLLSACPGLITIYEDDYGYSRVQLAHLSVKEYLYTSSHTSDTSGRFGFPEQEAHFHVTETCLIYLLIQSEEESLISSVDRESFQEVVIGKTASSYRSLLC